MRLLLNNKEVQAEDIKSLRKDPIGVLSKELVFSTDSFSKTLQIENSLKINGKSALIAVYDQDNMSLLQRIALALVRMLL